MHYELPPVQASMSHLLRGTSYLTVHTISPDNSNLCASYSRMWRETWSCHVHWFRTVEMLNVALFVKSTENCENSRHGQNESCTPVASWCMALQACWVFLSFRGNSKGCYPGTKVPGWWDYNVCSCPAPYFVFVSKLHPFIVWAAKFISAKC